MPFLERSRKQTFPTANELSSRKVVFLQTENQHPAAVAVYGKNKNPVFSRRKQVFQS